MATAKGQGLQIAAHIVAADDVQHDVHALALREAIAGGHEVSVVKADGLGGAQFAQGAQALALAIGHDDARAGGMRHLYRQRADAATAAMDEHAFSHAQAAQLKEVVPDREQAFGQGAGRLIAQLLRHGQGVLQTGHAPGGIAPAGQQAHEALAHQVLGHAGPAGDDLAAGLQTEDIGHAGGRLAQALALHDVGPVDAGRAHAQQHFAGAGRRHGPAGQRQDGGISRFAGDDGLHVVRVLAHGRWGCRRVEIGGPCGPPGSGPALSRVRPQSARPAFRTAR